MGIISGTLTRQLVTPLLHHFKMIKISHLNFKALLPYIAFIDKTEVYFICVEVGWCVGWTRIVAISFHITTIRPKLPQ